MKALQVIYYSFAPFYNRKLIPLPETFVTAEVHKVGVVTQREVVDAEGNVRRETIPPEKWDADLASTSEEIVKAERHEEHKGPINMKDMQEKSIKKLVEKEQKLNGVQQATPQ